MPIETRAPELKPLPNETEYLSAKMTRKLTSEEAAKRRWQCVANSRMRPEYRFQFKAGAASVPSGAVLEFLKYFKTKKRKKEMTIFIKRIAVSTARNKIAR